MKTSNELLADRAAFAAEHAPGDKGTVRAKGDAVEIAFPELSSLYPGFSVHVRGNDVSIEFDRYVDPAEHVRRRMTSDNILPGTNLAPNAFALAASRKGGDPSVE